MEASQHVATRRPAIAVPQVVRDYVALTKPKVQSLLLFTTVAAMFVAGPAVRGASPDGQAGLAVPAVFVRAGTVDPSTSPGGGMRTTSSCRRPPI